MLPDQILGCKLQKITLVDRSRILKGIWEVHREPGLSFERFASSCFGLMSRQLDTRFAPLPFLGRYSASAVAVSARPLLCQKFNISAVTTPTPLCSFSFVSQLPCKNLAKWSDKESINLGFSCKGG